MSVFKCNLELILSQCAQQSSRQMLTTHLANLVPNPPPPLIGVGQMVGIGFKAWFPYRCI